MCLPAMVPLAWDVACGLEHTEVNIWIFGKRPGRVLLASLLLRLLPRCGFAFGRWPSSRSRSTAPSFLSYSHLHTSRGAPPDRDATQQLRANMATEKLIKVMLGISSF